MKENTTTKPTKKKRLLFWLILAASLLIIAAIVLGIVFGVRGGSQEVLLDKDPGENQENNGGNPPSDLPSDKDKDHSGDTVDTSSQYEFIAPIENVNLIKAHEFCYDKTMDWYRLHQAMDFGAPAGTNILAAVDGKVTQILTDDVLDYAVIEIAHADNVTTVYKFVDPLSTLKVGQEVSRGDVIGTVAVASGRENADGEHLHFEVFKNGSSVDPDDYLHITTK